MRGVCVCVCVRASSSLRESVFVGIRIENLATVFLGCYKWQRCCFFRAIFCVENCAGREREREREKDGGGAVHGAVLVDGAQPDRMQKVLSEGVQGCVCVFVCVLSLSLCFLPLTCVLLALSF